MDGVRCNEIDELDLHLIKPQVRTNDNVSI
jgi:hypothetical protein